MNLKLITDVEELKGVSVIVRASLNVPLENGKVRNTFRLHRATPTLEYLRNKGAKIIVIGHIGREPHETLQPVFEELKNIIPMSWGGSITDPAFSKIKDAMEDGDVIMCENLRQDVREKDNDSELVEIIAQYGDIYVNDAFAVVHRDHASILGLAKRLPAYAGITLAEEVSKLSAVMQPESPSLFILGGAKFQTKMPLIEKYLELYEQVFIGGAIANDIFKARGYEVGKSLISDVSLEDAPFLWDEKLLIPIDVVVEGPDGIKVKMISEVSKDESIYDMGPESVKMLEPFIRDAKTVLWNGPFGNYEAGFVDGTESVAKLIAKADGYSVLGGGDTVAAVDKLGLNDDFEFVSIGGGSMLIFLEHGSTPALDALSK
jgi:phosphoglycerate kinase